MPDSPLRAEAENLPEHRVEQLLAANEAQARFAETAAHDLKEPLRMVTAMCALLSSDYGDRLDERGRDYLSLMTSATRRMRDLIDDLLELGRLGSPIERNSWFDSNAQLDLALADLGEAIRESGAEISRGVLPMVRANPARFTRLLENLIGNALKYVAPGVRPRIRVSAARSGAFWRFSVSDNGLGVPARYRRRIFEPFERLQPKGLDDGAGLGLAICQKIVDGFGGRIWVESKPGGGSMFRFTVKACEEGGDEG